MMRSLSSAVGGLRAHQTKMDVIGNNIANVNTYGFKSSRATFSDVYYQTMSKGSSPSATMGGTNPTQIGYGASVATIDVMNTQSGLASTDRAMDIYLNGDGMIVSRDTNGNLYYTRLGILGFDAEGNLVDANGHFIMGFPMDDAGNPIVNPDGTCDIDSLAPIQIDPEMLDQMTGISIGPNGEIIGTMPGDVTTSLNKKRPDWLTDLQVAEDSNLVGDIKVTTEYRSASEATLGEAWIDSLNCKPNSRVDGTYTFSYNNGTITATNTTTNEILTGTYRKGSVVEMTNARGQVVMTITTNKLNEPDPALSGNFGSLFFEEKLMLSIDATDKGGNRVFEEIEIDKDNPPSKITLGDVTISINANSAADITNMVLTYDNTNAFATNGWLTGASLNPNATYSGASLSLRAGISQDVTINNSTINTLNFLDLDAVEDMVKALREQNPSVGNYSIRTKGSSVTSNFVVEIYDPNNPSLTLATSDVIQNAGDDISFTVGTDTFIIGNLQPAHIDPTDNTTITLNINNLNLAGIKEYPTLQLVSDNGSVYAEAQYNGAASTVTLGDLSIKVDKDLLNAYFAGRPHLSDAASTVNLGRISAITEKAWIYSNNAANAQPGIGDAFTIGNLVIAKIPNMVAMEQNGQSYFTTTANSGEASFVRPGIAGTGTIKAGYLEMSNVDIAKEFTDMITTQRGFQANTRIITVSDEMLQELVNLKR